MDIQQKLFPLVLVLYVCLALCGEAAHAQGPTINPKFPVGGEGSLSPPSVLPIHECARAVYVYGFVPKATVRVLANGVLVGQDTPVVGFARINLNRALVLGDVITATQTVGAISSGPSYDPVVVSSYPALTTPVVGPDLYACGRIVPVGNLVASTHVEVKDVETGQVIGTGEATSDWEPVFTSSLVAGHHITAVQIACPNDSAKTATSPVSQPVIVKPEPNPLLPPTVDPPVIFSNTVTVHELYVGSEVQVNQGGPIGFGFSTAADNWFSVAPSIKPSPPRVLARQKLCSTSPPSKPVDPTDRLSAAILGAPICEGSHYVMIDNTVLDANVVLLRSGTVIGYGGAVLGTLKLAVGSGIRLNAGDVLTATEYIGNIVSPPSNQVVVGCDGAENVSTQHNNNYRTGAYLHETTLTPAQILARGMRVKYAHSVDGYIHTQPLYIRNVDFKTGRANGLFLATTANKVYALNADTGIEKWSTPLLDSNPGQRGLGRVVSIGATPVIDVAGDRMYVLFSTKNEQKESANCPDSSHPDPKCWTYEDQLASLDVAYWLVVLDYRDGSELARVPVKASLYRSDGTSVTFTPKNQMDRAALLLDHGSVYLGFAARFAESIIEYHGWVLRYRARDLSFQGAFCTSRDATVQTDPFTQHKAEGAGIWQGGGGLAADADGNIYFLVGNGPADLFSYKFGDAFVKLTPSGNNLSSSAFIPSDPTSINKNCPNDPTKDCSNDPNTLYVKDVDLGAGGAMVLPKTKLVIGGGKTGYMYLLNKDDMTLRQQFAASTNLYSPPGTDLRWQDWDAGPHLHGSPTYWRGPDPTYGYLYVWGEKDYLRLYRFNTATQKIEEPNFRQGTALALENTMPGGMMSVSANGNAANSGVVWATLPEALFPGPVRLYAFHAETLQWLWDTRVPSPGHWVAPTIGDGKVFIATSSGEVIAYELSPKSNFPRPRQQKKPFQPQSPPGELPLAQRYPDEASIRALPIIALNALAPPQGLVRVAVLEGEATETYEAGETSETGAFAWQSTKTTAILRTIAGSGPEPPSRAVRVELLPGPVWHASDGSMARGTIEKGFPAPEKQDASWMLFKVTTAQGRGILGGAKYIQRVFTRGGAPPTAAPQQKGATVRVPYHARYVVYR